MKKEIESLKNRNKKVEQDKAWETSKTRKSLISLLTYFIVVLFLYRIDASNPWLTAFVPTIGFLLSTLTLNFFKKIWVKKFYKE